MRITGGTVRGLTITAPPGFNTRPMTDMAKQGIFNILREEVVDASVLDLFAGSGALGLEALSRGAGHCCFVENSREALRCLKANLDKAGFAEQCEVLCRDAYALLLDWPDWRFDLCFFDPPYVQFDNPVTRRRCVDFLDKLATMAGAPDAVVVLHYRRGCMAGMPIPPIFVSQDVRCYGESEIMLLRIRSEQSDATAKEGDL